MPKVDAEVAVGEDLDFVRSWWRFDRLAWMFFVLLIVLDLAGAFGRGPLAHAHAENAHHSVAVHYERIQRTGTPSLMTIELQGDSIREGKASLFVS